ncbi:activator-dependent family glycosyltransferase [Streptomyces sp. H27-D2]|uniref:activator-dependent family glycosyltransferase n=1 Tax=Streptomyces sp. H27-D2 TaxID=3046304 RepID=UPI002DB91D1F|nr:activator-dependent family glycosyltransferase [Streptomyces sp. H27-D2]MEC4017331.1 activator-dependent family glycosyltransferase [Streptomyces sp. H27-D2]
MRVLFTVWPMTAHLYPTIPLAWALQGAGHEVCVASHPALSGAITAAGLTAVPLGGEDSMPALSSVGDFMLDQQERDLLAKALDIDPADKHAWHMFSYYTLASLRIFHTEGVPAGAPAPGADRLVEFAKDWRPDLVLWDLWPAAAVAARVSGAAHARLLWGPDYCGWARNRFLERGGRDGTGIEDPLVEVVRPVAERYGVEVDDELLLGQWTVDPTPAPLRLPTRTRVVPVRRVPYTGAAVVPDWLYPRPERPRVALSLGVSGRMFQNDAALISDMLEMVAELDVEVVATLNDVQLAGQRVPANVRTIDYLPLNQLLPTCSAIVHHGGGGTLAAAVAQRVPQLILEEEGVEAAAYASYLTGHGAGLTLNPREQSVPQMRERLVRVLEEPAFRRGTEALHADWLAMPSPNDVVPVLERLTARHQRRG